MKSSIFLVLALFLITFGIFIGIDGQHLANALGIKLRDGSPETYMILGWSLGILGLPFLLLAWMYWPTKKNNTPATYHGSVGFGEIAKNSDLVFQAEDLLPPGTIYLAPHPDSGKYYVALPREIAVLQTLLLGPNGSGKTRSIIMPSIAWTPSSFVCTDPKGELWEMTSGFHDQVRRYAPTEPDASECLNWIPLCRTDARLADSLARAIIESGQTKRTDQFWLDGEAAILSALFVHTAGQPEPTPATAYAILTNAPNGNALIATLQKSTSPVARDLISAAAKASDKVRGDMLTSVIARMRWMTDDRIKRFTSASLQPPDFRELQQQPVGVYWVLHERDLGYLKPLSALFFTLVLDQLAEGKLSNKPTPVTFFLDEFASIGVIQGFDSTITIARGRGLAFVVCVQALSQIRALYGPERGETIIVNLRSKLILPGITGQSAEEISRDLGDTTTTVDKISRTDSFQLTPSYTYSQTDHRRRLLTSDEVRRLGENEGDPDMIAIITNRRPLYLWRHWYNKKPATAQATALGPALITVHDDDYDTKPLLPPPLPEFADSTSLESLSDEN
jgi:type IV secretion system protein VirD4